MAGPTSIWPFHARIYSQQRKQRCGSRHPGRYDNEHGFRAGRLGIAMVTLTTVQARFAESQLFRDYQGLYRNIGRGIFED
jgi:hypothetical protein